MMLRKNELEIFIADAAQLFIKIAFLIYKSPTERTVCINSIELLVRRQQVEISTLSRTQCARFQFTIIGMTAGSERSKV